MDRQTAISKIKKCLALSSSANEHEAAMALKQAHALMAQFEVDEVALRLSEIAESSFPASAKRRPALWEASLVTCVANAFGCKTLFSSSWAGGKWVFVGKGVSAEIAHYACAVLMRQVRRARAEFIETGCRRLRKTASKTRRADLFCESWVATVNKTIRDFAGVIQHGAELDLYFSRQFGDLSSLEAKDRNQDMELKEGDLAALRAGQRAGREAKLNRAVGGSAVDQARLFA